MGADQKTNGTAFGSNHIGCAIIADTCSNGRIGGNTISIVWQVGIFVTSTAGVCSYIDVRDNILDQIRDNGIRTQYGDAGSVHDISIAYNQVSNVNIDCIRIAFGWLITL